MLEKRIKRRLERYNELEYLLPDIQYGFRRGKSYDDCLALTNLEIYKAFIMDDWLGTLFLDLKAAYDNVDPSILFNIINNLRIPIGYKIFIKNLLNYRFIDIYESSLYQGTRMLFKGLPQRSVLSPLFFNLYIKDIVKLVPYNCKIIQIADDIVILY